MRTGQITGGREENPVAGWDIFCKLSDPLSCNGYKLNDDKIRLISNPRTSSKLPSSTFPRSRVPTCLAPAASIVLKFSRRLSPTAPNRHKLIKAMTPPCRVFPASQLPAEIQLVDGKRRKGGKIDPSACELLSMTQYDCQIDRPDLSNSPVRCWPVQRWFRRYVFRVVCLARRNIGCLQYTSPWRGSTCY